MNQEPDHASNLSRRSAIKKGIITAVVGLFGFVPTAQYLIDAKPALAYVPCQITDCVYLGRICVQHSCGPSTWVEGYDCQDVHTRAHCFYRNVDTYKKC